MDDQKKQDRTKELAEAMKAAALADEQQHNNPQSGQRAGLIGGNYLWGLVASRVITMMEEIAREAVDQWLNPPAGSTSSAPKPNIPRR